MASPATILFALTGDVRKNSRAIKQFRVWLEMGFEITALTFGEETSTFLLHERLKLVVLPKPEGSGMRFFWKVHRLFQKVARQHKATVYHASDLYVLPALAQAARQHRGRLVFDSRELYPYVAATTGRPWVSLFWHGISSRYIRQADAVFTVSESIADRLVFFYDIPKPHLLFNVPERPQSALQPSPYLRQTLNLAPDKVLILHQGNLQRSRGGFPLVQAMQHVEGAVLVFMGDGPEKAQLEKRVLQQELTEKIRFVPAVSPDALLPITAGADLGVTLLEDTCLNHRFALPNKLFEYLMAGLPVLASDLPEIRKVIEEFDVGKLVNPRKTEELASALQEMVNNAEARNQWKSHTPKVFETFSWESASNTLKAVYAPWLSPL